MALCNSAFENTASPRNNIAIYRDSINASDVDILVYLDDNLELFRNVSEDCNANIDQLWLVFKDIVNHCVEIFILLKRKVTRRLNSWIT